LRRPFLSDRYFFITVRLLPRRTKLMKPDFTPLARAISRVRWLAHQGERSPAIWWDQAKRQAGA
jgi:hypothetical protein